MAAAINADVFNLMLNALGDSTDGLIRIWIYDDSNTIIGSEETIAWATASTIYGTMSMSSADIVFPVPANTIVSGLMLSFYDGTLSDGIAYSFEQQYTYNNAGTFTVTDVTLQVTN